MSSRDMKFPTPEELDELWFRNEHFHGKVLRLQKKQQYMELRDILTELLEKSAFISTLKGTGISERLRCSQLYLDVRTPMYFDPDEMELFEQAIRLADLFNMAVSGSKIRCSFSVTDVWAE